MFLLHTKNTLCLIYKIPSSSMTMVFEKALKILNYASCSELIEFSILQHFMTRHVGIKLFENSQSRTDQNDVFGNYKNKYCNSLMDPKNHKEYSLGDRRGKHWKKDETIISDSGTTVGKSKKDIYEYYSDHPSVIFSGPNDIGISDMICAVKDGQEYISGISEVILYCNSELVDKSVLFYRNLGLNVSTQQIGSTLGMYHNHPQTNQSQPLESFIKLSPSENCKVLSYDSAKKLSLLIDLEFVVDFFRNRILFDKTQILDPLGNVVEIKAWNRKDIKIAILTSGGDAPGMNSVVKSVVRTGIKYNIPIYGVYRGFEGLMNGDIRKLSWNSETHNSYLGGTTLLSVRSDKFKTREGRKEAVLNLSKRGINNLIIIGGDGSMTGGLILKEEFGELVKELEVEGRYDNPDPSYNARREDKFIDETLPSTDMSVDSSYKYLHKVTRACNIIGIPATIDNDVYGSEITIGSDSCLTRIMDAVDNLLSTMRSHRRVFVIETMGRNCGWIALLSAFAVSADFVLLPEHIYSKDGKDYWKQELIKSIKTAYNNHKPDILIFLSEGAVDLQFNKIDLETVVGTVREAGFDVRGLTLGHIQRGGYTSAQDRIIGTVSGIKVVNEILLKHSFKNEASGQNKQINCKNSSPLSSRADHSSKEHDISFAEMIAYNCDEYSFIDLEKVIFETKKLKGFYDSKDFKSIFLCRHRLFKYIFNHFEKLRINKIRTIFTEGRFDYHIGEERIFEEVKVHNLFSKKFVRIPQLCDGSKGCNGSDCTDSSGSVGAINGNFQDIQKVTVGIIMDGVRACGMNTAINMLCEMGISSGANILYFLQGYDGVISNQPIEAKLYEFSTKINDGGVGIGSSKTIPPIDSMISALKSYGIDTLVIIGGSRNLRVISDFKKFSDISAILIPATSKNNIPGTSKSIGTDSALNIITRSTVANKLSAAAMENTIFMVEIGGDNCSYLSIMGGIASSAYEVLINNVECSKENHCRAQSESMDKEQVCADEIVLSKHNSISANASSSTESTDDLKPLGYLKSHLVENFGNYKRSSIVIFRNQNTFNKMSTESLCKLLRHDSYQISYSILGHLEKGLYPTFIDRVNANLLSIMALNQGVKAGQHCGVVGFKCTKPHFTDIETVLEMYDKDLETTKCPFWLKYKDICGFLEE